MENYYDILNVPHNATEADIKKAYRSLSLKFHPDRNPTDTHPEYDPSLFPKINQAYEVLSDPSKRQQYDIQLKFGVDCGNGSIDDELNEINNIIQMMFRGAGGGGAMPPCPTFVNEKRRENPLSFMNFFGGGNGEPHNPNNNNPNIHIFHTDDFSPFRQRPSEDSIQIPDPIEVVLNINLYEAYHGCVKEIEYERTTNERFNNCVELLKTEVTIPPGVNDMEEFLLKAKGDKSSGNIVGDVMVIVEIQKDAVYEKRGLDIVYKKRISLKESLCGFSFDLKHLNHRIIKINNQNNRTVIPPNHSKTIPKFGFIRDNTAGNLVIEFLVEFPESLTEQQIETVGTVL